MAVTSVGTPVFTRSSTSPITSAWGTGQNRTAGNLLVAVVSAIAQTSVTAPGAPAGWTKPVSATAGGRCSLGIFTRIASGADAAPSFSSTLTGTGALTVTLFELAGADPTVFLQTQGTATGTTTATLNVTTTAAVAQAGSYAISGTGLELTAAATDTATPAGGWSSVGNDSATSDVVHMAVIVQANPSAGSALTGSVTWGAGGNSIAGVIGVFQPPVMAAPVVRRAAPRVVPQVRGQARGNAGVSGQLGPQFYPLNRPASAVVRPLPIRGHVTSRAGIYGQAGPAVTPQQRALRARLPQQPPPRGQVRSNLGSSVQAVTPFTPLTGPVRAACRPLPQRGRAQGHAGVFQGSGPAVKPLQHPVYAWRPGSRRGVTVTSIHPSAVVYGPPFYPFRRPVRAWVPPPPRGRSRSLSGTFTAVVPGQDVRWTTGPPGSGWVTGEPFGRWADGPPGSRWQTGTPFSRTFTGPPMHGWAQSGGQLQ